MCDEEFMALVAKGQTENEANEPSEEFFKSVQSCLEEILSKENLAEDVIVQQSINAQMYIPIYILAAHPKVLSLGSNANAQVLLTAAQRSLKLSVDADTMMIRPTTMKARRNVIILRELPEDTTESELREMLQASKHYDKLTAVKPDVNNTTYITFETDESAQDVALWLRSQKFRGEPVKCAMKSDHFMRSFYPAQPSLGSTPAGSWPASPWTGPMSWPSPGIGAASYETSPQTWTMCSAQDGEGGFPGKGKGKRGKGKGKGKDDPEAMMMEAQRKLEQAIEGTSFQTGLAGNDETAEVGYNHAFRAYLKEQIVDICSKMEVVAKPDSFITFEKANKDAHLFRPSPCKDWAPPPTPMVGFSPNTDMRRAKSTATDDGDDVLTGTDPNRRRSRSRKASANASQGSWSRNRSSDWNDWDWGSGGAVTWTASQKDIDRKRNASRKRGGWDEWYGQAWTQKDCKDGEHEKGEKREAATPEKEEKPNKPSWVEKVKGLPDKGGAPQKWQAKTKSKAEVPSTAGDAVGAVDG